MADDVQKRLRELGLLGLAARYDEIRDQPWLATVMAIEREERLQRGLERRTRTSRIGRFKSLSDFDWGWPRRIDRMTIEELTRLAFMEEEANVVVVGPNGTGKTMIAKNIAHSVIRAGKTARFVTASAMLNELAAQDGVAALGRTFRRYTSPALLVIDELGYVAYANRHADMLFEVVNRRYESGRSIVVTTNRAFQDWGELFPNATCVVPLVDRLIHRSEIIEIDGDSYRLKEAQERKARPRRT
ncbi:MAG: ATP-binding protein [Planctomycetes bacterium]|nr:IS21-like element helper ATPase IstB [Myxococcales bacterium]MCB9902737.1 ATP-binding protein [Planctomycetota bacterium]